MKKKKKRVSPSAVFVTGILIFIIPVVYYAFVWVPERKAQLSDRYMRIVAMMSDQLETRGKNIIEVIGRAEIKKPPTICISYQLSPGEGVGPFILWPVFSWLLFFLPWFYIMWFVLSGDSFF